MLNTTQMKNKPRITFGIPDRPESLSRTKQSFKAEADINNIMKRYYKTGILGNPLDQRKGYFGDFTDTVDYHTMSTKLIEIDQQFQTLPSKVREKFNNSPQAALDFLADEKNTDEAVDLGLLPPSAKRVAAPATPENRNPEPPKNPPAGQPAGQPAQPLK